MQDRLRSLSIPREQRPGAKTGVARSRWGLLVTLLILVILAAAGYVAWSKLRPGGAAAPPAPADGQPIRLLKVTPRNPADADPVLTATGKIVSDHRVEVATKVSGQVTALYFEQGDRVERGQILAAIDDELPRARRDEATANLAQARANLEYQRVNFERITRLHEDRQASDIEYADAQRALHEGQAQVDAAEAVLASAEKVLRDCRVPAPISGVILERNVEVGDFVAAEGGRGAMANSQFAAIADMTKLRVEVDISELAVNRLRPDLPCVVIPDAYKDRRYHGRVLWIDPGANYAKATVQVKVRIDDPDDYLRVEGAAQVQFLPSSPASATATATSPAGLWIPSSACRVAGDGRTARVFVARDGRLMETAVTLGRRENDNLEVLAGLSAGDEIAIGTLDQVKDGQAAPR